jgi:thiazolylpeptide-type bacteriocin precursor
MHNEVDNEVEIEMSASSHEQDEVEMSASSHEQEIDLGLEDLEIEKLELNDFLDASRFNEGNAIAKVMAASCTTCECCCSY